MSQDECIIKLENVSKDLKKKRVLSDISASIYKGKVYGFIGSNGSGKTMLLRAIAGLLYINKGTVDRIDPAPTMGVIIENPGFLISYTGYENLQMLAAIRNIIGEKEIQTTLLQVGLDPKDRRKVKEYSLGMKQRLAVAQAIMENPDVLILDKPFRVLDEERIKTIRTLLEAYNRAGGTIFLSSHDPEDISLLCHHVYMMQEGKMTQMK